MKKIISLLLVIALTASVAIGGTLAYLTDRESEANVFTMGDVSIKLDEEFQQGATLIPGVDIDKKPTITNTGKNDAWVFATVAVPAKLSTDQGIIIDKNTTNWTWTTDVTSVTYEGVDYNVYTVLYNEALAVDGTTAKPVFNKVSLNSHVDIDPDGEFNYVENGTATPLGWNLSDGNPVIHVSAYAVQKEGFATAAAAYEAYKTQWADGWMSWGVEPTLVYTADELTKALSAGESVTLANDIAVKDTTITIASGKAAELNLNGHKLTSEMSGTGNQDMFLVKGELTVSNGEIGLKATVNQGWGAMATIFDITAGGVVNLDGVDMEVSGTDMSFCAHLNNWGEATLNARNSNFKSNYVAIRVFNSGYDMNNVTLENCKVEGASNAFWVHNYTEADFGSAEKAASQKDLLNFEFTGCTFTGNPEKAGPIRLGMTNSIYGGEEILP